MLLQLKVAILVKKGLVILLYIALYITVKNNKNFATRSRVRKKRCTLGMLVLLSLYSCQSSYPTLSLSSKVPQLSCITTLVQIRSQRLYYLFYKGSYFSLTLHSSNLLNILLLLLYLDSSIIVSYYTQIEYNSSVRISNIRSIG